MATAIAYSMNTEFSKVLAEQMHYFSHSREVEAITKVHGHIGELKDIVVKNIGSYYNSIIITLTLYVRNLEASKQ